MFQDDTTGLRFGNFEVLVRPDGSVHELGRGGFGRTVLARHSLLDTEVALKLIDERHALNEAARARFLKEAKEQARLTHPGIARITDCGIVEGQLYYAVELCTGGHLKEYVAATGPLNVPDTFHILTQAAEALEYSHRRGVVHLDVKPSNLMLVFDEEGVPQVKLIDFGLVQRTTAEAAPTGADGQPLFSPAFASPEQIRALPTDARSDLFSLGMTGWYLLTGKNPVEGAADVVIRERLMPAEYESLLPAQLTGRLRSVLSRLVRKNAAERYSGGAELLADLRNCLQGMPPLGGGWQRRQRSSGILADRFILEKGTPSRMGMVHPALDKQSRHRVKVTLLRRGTAPSVIHQYQNAAEALRDSEGNGLVRVLEVKEFNEGWVVVEEASAGVSLTEVLRREGALPLGRYAPLVWLLGHAMDTAFAAGLTSIVLEEAMVELPPVTGGKNIDWSHVILMVPVSLSGPEQAPSQDADVTRTGDFTLTTTSTVGGVQLLARWVYFITGGKNPPPSSLYSIKEYVNIPTLSEQTNQIVARHLCGQSTTARCEEMLRQIFGAEGLSWDAIGDRVRAARWNVVLLHAGAVMQGIEQSVTAAEKIAGACAPLADAVPDEVRECYAAVSAVYEAATAARARHEQLGQGNRDLKAGRAAVAGLEDISRQAHGHFETAETAFRALKEAAERRKREEELRQRRHRELMEAITGACRRTEAAAEEARELAAECRDAAPGSAGVRQIEALVEQTGSLARQLESLRDETAAAPEKEWDRLESQLPRARQIAADADEMARTCHSHLVKARAEVRRREEEEKARAAAAAVLAAEIGKAEQSAAEIPGMLEQIGKLAAILPSLEELERGAVSDSNRAAEIVQGMQALRTRDDNEALLEAVAATAEVRRLLDAMRRTLERAREAFVAEEKLAEAARAAALTLTQVSAAAEKASSAAATQLAGHGLTIRPGTPAAASLEHAAAAAAAALQCREEIESLRASLASHRSEAARLVDQARSFATAGERHAAETARHLREAKHWVDEAERQARVEEENARARAAAAIAEAVGHVEREVKRARDAFMRAGQHADIPAATAFLANASAAWNACQEKHRAVRQWQTARPPELAADEDFLERIASERRALFGLADSVEQAAHAAAAAAGAAAREAEERQRQELEARRRKEEEERRLREEEGRRRAAEAAAKRQAELAEQKRREEEALRIAGEQEAKRQVELAEQKRREDEALRIEEENAAEARRLAEEEEALRQAERAEQRRIEDEKAAELRRIAEAEAAELRRIEEEARRKAEAEAAEHRRIAAEARRKAEAEAVELSRLEEEARRKAEAAAAEQRRREEEAKRLAAAEDKRRQAEIAAQAKAEAEANRKAAAEEKRRLEAEEKKRQAEEAALRKQEAEAKRKADAEEKRRLAEAAAKQKQEADAKRKADAEEKRRREAEEKQKLADAAKLKQEEESARKTEAEAKRRLEEAELRQHAEAAKVKQEADANLKSETEEKRRQVEIAAQLRLAAENKQPGRAAETEPVVQGQRKVEKTGRSKAPLMAAAAVVVAGGAAAAWWAMRDNDNKVAIAGDPQSVVVTPPPVPLPVVPPPPSAPVTHTVAINLAGDAVTSGMVSAKDITLHGHDEKSLTTTADGFALKIQEGTPPVNISIGGVAPGFKVEPATLSISSAGDARHTVTITRETGRVTIQNPPADSPSFHRHAILTWKGPKDFAPPGVTPLTLKAGSDVPTGQWSVTLDDDEPADGKAGSSGLIVDGRDAGVLEIKPGQSATLAMPPGLPPLLYSVVEWPTQTVEGEEKVTEGLLEKMLKDAKLPFDDPDVKKVVAGLSRTLARPVHSYPLCLVRREDRFFLLRPVRKKFIDLLSLGTDRIAMTAGIAKLVGLPVNLEKLNPAAAEPGAVPWKAVKDCLLTARRVIAESKIGREPDALTLIAEIDSSLDILRITVDNNWSVPAQDVALFAATWDEVRDSCTGVRVSADGTVNLGFAMNEKSRRDLIVGPKSDGRFPVQMPAGARSDEKDTFTGNFAPLPALPTALAGKVPK